MTIGENAKKIFPTLDGFRRLCYYGQGEEKKN